MKILVTGGAGFIGSHASEYYAKKGHDIIAYDNLSREKLLKKDTHLSKYNWDYLDQFENITKIKADILDINLLKETAKDCDIIIHTAAQTAVTTSVVDPISDFHTNALGTFNVLEAARTAKNNPTVIYCSTNKVYGENVNSLSVIEDDKRYRFEKVKGVKEDLSIDHCEHTPYGCSKLTGDLYMQDYAKLYGIKTGIFRMSCIYGTRQFGFEDQGWLAWFAIATIMNRPINIFGDGKQVRDILFATDLIESYDAFIKSNKTEGIFNTGGGPNNTLSLLELLDMLEDMTGKRSQLLFYPWRPSDQKVYISDIDKIKDNLNWEPKITPKIGVQKLIEFVESNKTLF